MSQEHSSHAPPRRLYRSRRDRMLAGVCGGIAEYLEIDPILVRLVFLALLFSGIGVLIYLVAWILIPEEPLEQESPPPREADEESLHRMRRNTGILLIVVGGLLLIGELFPAWDLFRLWPLLLILLGIYLLQRRP